MFRGKIEEVLAKLAEAQPKLDSDSDVGAALKRAFTKAISAVQAGRFDDASSWLLTYAAGISAVKGMGGIALIESMGASLEAGRLLGNDAGDVFLLSATAEWLENMAKGTEDKESHSELKDLLNELVTKGAKLMRTSDLPAGLREALTEALGEEKDFPSVKARIEMEGIIGALDHCKHVRSSWKTRATDLVKRMNKAKEEGTASTSFFSQPDVLSEIEALAKEHNTQHTH